MKPKLVRQAAFTDDGRITSVPRQATERPEFEEQADLFTWQKTEEDAKKWKGGATE